MTDAVIGALRVALGLDTANFDAGMKRTKASLNDVNFGRGLRSALSDMHGQLMGAAASAGTLGTAMAAMGAAGLIAGAAVGGLAVALSGARSALAFADEISDAAAKLGVTTDALQEYRFAVHALGGDYRDADAALLGFSQAFGAAQSKMSTKAVKPFKQLGLDPQSFKDTEDALQAVVAKIGALSSSAEQAAIAEKLGLTPMLSALRAGGGQFDVLREKARALGFVMDSDMVARAGDMNDKMEDLNQIIGVQLKSAMVDLAPILLGLLGTMGDMARVAADMVDSFKSLDNKSVGSMERRRGELLAQMTQAQFGPNSFQGGKQTPDAQRRYAEARTEYDALGVELARRNAVAGSTATTPANPNLLKPGVDNSAAVRQASEAAIATASKDELAARMALVGDIQQLGALKIAQVEQETRAANAKLAEEAAQGKITAAAAQTAQALNTRALAEKKALIVRETQAALERHALEMAQRLAGFADDELRSRAEMATNATARNAIEAQMLARRQAADRQSLKVELDIQVDQGQISQAYEDEVLAAQAKAQLSEQEVADRKARANVQAEINAAAEAELQLQIDVASSQQGVAASAYERRNVQLKILALEHKLERLKLEEIVNSSTASDAEKAIATARLAVLDEIQKNETKAAAESVNLSDALAEAVSSVASMASALRKHDIGGALSSLAAALKQAAGAAGSSSGLGATLAAVSKTLGQIGQGVQIGQTITSALGQKQTTGGQIGSAIGSAVGLYIGGPIGAAIFATLGNAIGNLFKGGKESNYGAISTLSETGYTLSGDKRNSQTTQLATAASNAILAGEKALKDAGVQLATTVSSIDIGTRDATHIVLSNGQKLSSAVGDAAAAADAALKGVLDGATYTSDAQKALAESMLAAGKSFDEIATAMKTFADAQAIPADIASAIQKLKDPEAYDLAELKKTQADRRAQYAELAAEGYLTADKLAGINDQLSVLEGLELDNVMKSFADSVRSAASSAVTDARSALSAAYDQEASALKALVDQFQGYGDNLKAYAAKLGTDSLSTGSAGYSALQSAFEQMAARAQLGDTSALGGLQGLGDQFLSVSKSTAKSSADYQRDVARVRAAADKAGDTALRQADIARSQLSELQDAVQGLVELNTSVLSVKDAVAGLAAALTGYSKTTGQYLGANPSANAALADATGYRGDFGSGGFQAWIVQQDEATKAKARAVLTAFGQTNRISGFATGGSFRVGGFGATDSQLIQMHATPGELVDVTTPGQAASVASEIRQLRSELKAANVAIARNTRQTAQLQKRWDGDGLPAVRSV